MKKGKQRFIAVIMALCLSSVSCPLLTVSAANVENTELLQTEISPR